MTKAGRGLAALANILAAAALCACGLAAADTIEGKIVAIADGDTLTLLTSDHRQVKIRVAGIDAPEKAQAFGQAAKKAMSDCAFGKQANVEWKKLDRFGRTIGKLTVDGADCGLRQIELGLAWHYKAYEREQQQADRLAYAEAERDAQKAGRGLWAEAHPTPPWDFRHAAKNQHGATAD